MKRVLLIVISVLLIISSFTMLLIDWKAVLFLLIGIALLVYGIKSKKAPTDSRPGYSSAAPAAGSTSKSIAPEGMPSSKPRKQVTCKLAGVTFECRLDDSEMRQNVLRDMEPGDPIEIKEYTYKGKRAYMVIDPGTQLDVGNIPADIAEVFAQYPDPTFEGFIKDLDEFENDDGDTVCYGQVRVFLI